MFLLLCFTVLLPAELGRFALFDLGFLEREWRTEKDENNLCY